MSTAERGSNLRALSGTDISVFAHRQKSSRLARCDQERIPRFGTHL